MSVLKNFVEFIKQYHWYVLLTIVIGALLGFLACILYGKIENSDFVKRSKRRFENLENWIMGFSFVIAVVCMINAASGNGTEVDSQYLSLYSSFIFAWILTKKTASRDFRKNQHKIAKSTYRHIEDAETAVLIAKNRIMEKRGDTLDDGDIQGLLDDLQIILTCIRSNKKDWRDMLTKSYRDKIDKDENPEDILAKDYYKEPADKNVNPSEVMTTFSDNIKEVQESN